MSSQEENQLPSSPPGPTGGRQRKPPPITPRRFNRFFSPRPSSGSSQPSSRSSRPLRSLEASDLNSRDTASSIGLQHEDDGFPIARPAKRRKQTAKEDIQDVISSSPPRSSPCPQLIPTYASEACSPLLPPTRIHRLRSYERLDGPLVSSYLSPSLRTRPEDEHRFTRHPYCTASLNTETLVAVGDQGGHISLLDTAADADFKRIFLDIRSLHGNAITDLTFDSNDDRLATIGGDRLANIIDMKTQETVWTLHSGHTSTPKRIIFQPDNESIVATCGRDGVVSLWDLRTNATPTLQIQHPSSDEQYTVGRLGRQVESDRHRLLVPYKCLAPGPVESGVRTMSESQISMSFELQTLAVDIVPDESHMSQSDANRLTQAAAPNRPTSLTSINFLPNGNSHLLLTSTSDNDILRIFDIRANVRGTAAPVPVSTVYTSALSRTDVRDSVELPKQSPTSSHGTVWTAFSQSGKYIYALTKGSRINVYSTSHLVLGQPPSSSQRPKTGRLGASPLFSLRHPELNVGSFYVRCAASDKVAGGGRGDVLAVGSSKGKPIVFDIEAALRGRDQQRRARSRGHHECKEVQSGQALEGGHNEQCEVTGVCWTPRGELVSVSDDATARVWRDDGLCGGEESDSEG